MGDELDELKAELKVPALPEMVFGSSGLQLLHIPTGLSFRFGAKEALQAWEPDVNADVKVAYSERWEDRRNKSDKDIMPASSYDWTFTSYYKGTIVRPENENCGVAVPAQDGEGIDYELLQRRDPILFFDEVELFHDELADNGDSLLNVKVRVMPSCFFVLMRFWLRIDDVCFRVLDNRYFHNFGDRHVIHEFQEKFSSFKELSNAGKLPFDRRKLADPNVIIPLLQKKNSEVNKIALL